MNKTNTLSNFKWGVVAALASVVLAACGGGGGSDSSTTTSTPTTTTVAATLITPVSSPVSLPVATGNPTGDGAAYLNAIRYNAGLSQLSVDAGLASAAQNHASYLVVNQTSGHNETSGLPGYTGDNPMSRITKAGNYSAMGETVIAGVPAAFTDSLTGVKSIFDAPYHRLIMLSDFKSFGTGSLTSASWEAFNVDFGNVASQIPDTGIVVYPYPGQTNVPVSWFANESPNPFVNAPTYELTNVGYPITVNSNFNGVLSSIVFSLTDASGNNVPCLAQTPATNSAELSNGALCVPYVPLTGSTTYTAHLAGVLTSSGQMHPINLTWQFKTQASSVSAVQQQGTQPSQRDLLKF